MSALAAPELALGHADRAARLIGAADEALRGLGATRLPTDGRRHDAVAGALRTSLGDAAFERLCGEGARLSLEQAVELALAVPAEAPLQSPASTRNSAGPRRVTASR